MAAGKNTDRLSFIDRLAGDKVVWIIVLCLCMVSLVSIFSSTSLLALQNHTSRLAIARGQVMTIAIGLVVMIICYKIKWINLYKWLAKECFIISVLILMLLILLSHGLSIPGLRAPAINGAHRWIIAFGVQISVFEVVKVLMVLYVAWAIDNLKNGSTPLTDWLSQIKHMGWLNSEFGKNLVYLFIPTLLTTAMVLTGGTSSALFMAGILFLEMLLGGVKFRYMVTLGGFGAIMLAACIGMYLLTKDNAKPAFNRIGTAISRLSNDSDDYESIIANSETKDQNYYDALDKIRQPYGAKVAIKNGGLIGRGAGQSEQKYKVAVMYEDYMFSFIVEEYGLMGGLIILMLYIGLLARASIIVRNCDNMFAKMAVAGLATLISGQAMFHIVINCDLGILTGQTLPLISHGMSSFLCFSVAFGIILSISKMAAKKIERQTANAAPLIEFEDADTVKSGLDDLDAFDTDGFQDEAMGVIDETAEFNRKNELEELEDL